MALGLLLKKGIGMKKRTYGEQNVFTFVFSTFQSGFTVFLSIFKCFLSNREI